MSKHGSSSSSLETELLSLLPGADVSLLFTTTAHNSHNHDSEYDSRYDHGDNMHEHDSHDETASQRAAVLQQLFTASDTSSTATQVSVSRCYKLIKTLLPLQQLFMAKMGS